MTRIPLPWTTVFCTTTGGQPERLPATGWMPCSDVEKIMGTWVSGT